MNKLILLSFSLLFFFLVATPSFAQKIKTKKGITYIDDIPYLKITGASGIENSHAKFYCYETEELFLVFTYRTYLESAQKHWYAEIKFANSTLTFNSSNQFIKPLIKSLYENNILTKNGTFKEEDLKNYIRLYNFTPPTND